MSTSKVFSGATLVSIPLGVLILLIWIAQLATLADLNGSDPAGNALAQAYGAAEIIVLWVLLAVLTIVAWTKGAMPGAAALAALILIPASGLAAITAAELLAEPDAVPFMWPIIIPAGVPPLIIAFCFWALLPLSRANIPARVAIGVAWGATTPRRARGALHPSTMMVTEVEKQRVPPRAQN